MQQQYHHFDQQQQQLAPAPQQQQQQQQGWQQQSPQHDGPGASSGASGDGAIVDMLQTLMAQNQHLHGTLQDVLDENRHLSTSLHHMQQQQDRMAAQLAQLLGHATTNAAMQSAPPSAHGLPPVRSPAIQHQPAHHAQQQQQQQPQLPPLQASPTRQLDASSPQHQQQRMSLRPVRTPGDSRPVSQHQMGAAAHHQVFQQQQPPQQSPQQMASEPSRVTPARKHPGMLLAEYSPSETLLCTRNLVPGRANDGEDLIPFQGQELRSWSPFESPVAAAIVAGLETPLMPEGGTVLLFGAGRDVAAAAHLSDVAGDRGVVFAIEAEPVGYAKLRGALDGRRNAHAIAGTPSNKVSYSAAISANVRTKLDAVVIDRARSMQQLADELSVATTSYVRKDGIVAIVVDVAVLRGSEQRGLSTDQVFMRVVETMRSARLKPLEQLTLEPFFEDVAVIVGRLAPPQ